MAEDVTNQDQTPESPAAPAPSSPEVAREVESLQAPAPRVDEAAPADQQRRRRGRRGDRGGPGGPGGDRGDRFFGEGGEVEETVVKVYRCATVVKGGRRFSFAALVVVGDRKGRVGIGYGKANEVPSAVEKAGKAARRSMVRINLDGTTIPHQLMARFGASKVVLVPAGEGTGVIAGGSVRAVMELAGVKNVLTKSFGSNSPKNLVRAAFEGLRNLRSKDSVARLRDVALAT